MCGDLWKPYSVVIFIPELYPNVLFEKIKYPLRWQAAISYYKTRTKDEYIPRAMNAVDCDTQDSSYPRSIYQY